MKSYIGIKVKFSDRVIYESEIKYKTLEILKDQIWDTNNFNPNGENEVVLLGHQKEKN